MATRHSKTVGSDIMHLILVRVEKGGSHSDLIIFGASGYCKAGSIN
jgi:hypothetical protein